MLGAAERPLIVAGGGIINADAADLLVELAELLDVPVVPTLMGWGTIPDDHRARRGHGRAADRPPVRQRDHAGVGLRAGHRQPLGQPAHRRPRHLPRGPHVRSRRHRTHPDRPGVRAGLRRSSPTPRRRCELFVAGARRRARPPARCRTAAPGWRTVPARKRTMQRKTHFDDIPIKPQRVYEEMNRVFGPRHPVRQHDRAVADRRRRSSCTCTSRGNWINAGQAGPLGWTIPAALGVVAADPDDHPSSRCPGTTTSSS